MSNNFKKGEIIKIKDSLDRNKWNLTLGMLEYRGKTTRIDDLKNSYAILSVDNNKFLWDIKLLEKTKLDFDLPEVIEILKDTTDLVFISKSTGGRIERVGDEIKIEDGKVLLYDMYYQLPVTEISLDEAIKRNDLLTFKYDDMVIKGNIYQIMKKLVDNCGGQGFGNALIEGKWLI